MQQRFCLIAFLFAGLVLQASPQPAFDLILAGGQVIDGSGGPAIRADVGISGERIERVGDLSKAKAKRRIDVRGLVVAPGFIDMLGQSEIHLLVDPRAMSKVMMGVTTEITGEGESVAPMKERLAHENAGLYNKYHLKVDWSSLGDYFARLKKQGMGVNLGTYVGAAQVREYVVGYDNRAPTESELEQMRQAVADAMQAGAFGVSSALEYVPGRFATTSELVELAKVAARYGGIYATHQRSEANAIQESLDEVFTIARQAKIPVEIFHLKTSYRQNWGKMGEILKKIEAARASGLDIEADVYPYAAASTALSASLPPWALEGGVDAVLKRLGDPAVRAKVRNEMQVDTKEWENIYLGSGGGSGVQIASVVNPSLIPYQGKRLSEIAAKEKKDPRDVLIDIVLADRGQTNAIYFIMSEDDVTRAVAVPWVSFCSDSEAHATDGPLSGTKSHPRGWGAFARVLSRYVREQKTLSLEQAIHKMTALPAHRVGLRDRGLLRAGMQADVTVFDPATVRDRATYEDPNQYAEGIRYVLVNGKLEVDAGKRTKVLAGKPLLGPGFKSGGRAQSEGLKKSRG